MLFWEAFCDEIEKISKSKGSKLRSGEFKGGKNEPAAKAPAGEGSRFQALKNKLARKGGVKDPGAVAAAIGRAKFGKGKFQRMAAAGK